MTTTIRSTAELQLELASAIRHLFRSGVMQHGGHGNASVRVDRESMVINTNPYFTDLHDDQFATVPMEGPPPSGVLPPAIAEIVRMHTLIYRLRPSVGAVIHTHSPAATTFAQAHRPLPVTYEALLHFTEGGEIPLAAWGPRGSDESLRAIEDVVAGVPTPPAVLLANHGLLALAETATRTAQLIVALEEAAELAIRATALGGAKPFPPGAHVQTLEHARKYSNG